jgi:hypothetical protein
MQQGLQISTKNCNNVGAFLHLNFQDRILVLSLQPHDDLTLGKLYMEARTAPLQELNEYFFCINGLSTWKHKSRILRLPVDISTINS